MKQLLLNFLFIFGSAFLYIQCVKVLIPASKLPNHQFQSHLKARSAGDNKNNTAFAISNAPDLKLNFKNKITTPPLKNTAFPYNMMSYINYHSLFYTPYVDVNYSELVGDYKGTPQHNN